MLTAEGFSEKGPFMDLSNQLTDVSNTDSSNHGFKL